MDVNTYYIIYNICVRGSILQIRETSQFCSAWASCKSHGSIDTPSLLGEHRAGYGTTAAGLAIPDTLALSVTWRRWHRWMWRRFRELTGKSVKSTMEQILPVLIEILRSLPNRSNVLRSNQNEETMAY